MWEEWVPHLEFVYNRVVHSTTQYSTFEIIHSFSPLTRLNLLTLPNTSLLKHNDGKTKVDFVKKLHEQVKYILRIKIKGMLTLQIRARKNGI